MQENTNKAIFVNSIILYIRLAVVALSGFLSTRFALQALGVVDYGLFSVVGSIISFIAIINTIMVSTSHRYIAVSIGRGDMNEANKQFNVCFITHIAIAVLAAIVAYPFGTWYINNKLSYSGDINNALIVYYLSVTASIITFVAVPFNGLLTAKENFKVYCIPDIISHILKLIVAYLITIFFTHKLFVYSATTSFLTIYPLFVYLFYCRKHYGQITKFKLVKDKRSYTEIVKFSGWVGYGAVASVGKTQGAALIVNVFYDTIMNTALGIANSFNSIIQMFAQNVSQPIAPQITKSYSSGNFERSKQLLVMSTKFTYLSILLVSSPFFVNTEWILKIWLGEVPPYAAVFTFLMIMDTLIDSLNSGIKHIIFANGNILLFQVIPSSLKLCSIVAAYYALKFGGPVFSLQVAYIVFSIIIFFANQYILHKTVGFDNKYLWKHSYLPSLLVTVLFVPIARILRLLHPLLAISIAFLSLSAAVFFICLSKREREYILVFMNR